MEGFHSVGLCLLCFDILPELDMGRGLMILSGVAIMPSILKPVFASDAKVKGIKRSTWIKTTCVLCMDLLALIVQCGYIPLVLITDHFYDHSNQDSNTLRIVEYACAIVLISFSWWENFIDNRFIGRIRGSNCWQQFIFSVKFDLQESRPVVSVFMSLWKIGVTCLMCWVLGRDEDVDMAAYFLQAFDKLKTQPFAENASILTLTLAAFVGHYVGYTACKLRLQRFSYDIPLILSAPLAVLIVSLDCHHYILEIFTDEELKYGCTDATTNWWHYLVGLAAWLSLYWIGRHIFFPNIERLAKTERYEVYTKINTSCFRQHI